MWRRSRPETVKRAHLFLYPSKHNYNALDIIAENVTEVSSFISEEGEELSLEGNITVLGFFGADPMENATVASNLKELVYDKFKGFKQDAFLQLLYAKTDLVPNFNTIKRSVAGKTKLDL